MPGFSGYLIYISVGWAPEAASEESHEKMRWKTLQQQNEMIWDRESYNWTINKQKHNTMQSNFSDSTIVSLHHWMIGDKRQALSPGIALRGIKEVLVVCQTWR